MNLHEIADINKINCLVDIHLHLDGALSINNIKKLAKIQNMDLNLSDEELLAKTRVAPNCKDLNEFLTKFEFPLTFLQTKEGIENAVYNLLEEEKEQGLIYVEIRFAPQLHLNKGLSQQDAVEAAIIGCKRASIKSTLILCMMRGAEDSLNRETIDVAYRFLNKGVGGIDLAGAEALFKTSMYKDLFAYASKLNIPFTIHAGEADDSSSVECAIKFGTKRIGHGIRAREKKSLLNEIADKRIGVEMCLTSNLNTCAISSIEDFPLLEYLEKGILVTINQDDSAISGITLKNEFRLLIEAFSLTYFEVKQLILNALNCAFISLTDKIYLTDLVKKTFDKIN